MARARSSLGILVLVVGSALSGAVALSQDKHQEAVLPSDGKAPLLEVVSPLPGTTLGAASKVEVVVKASDDSGRVRVFIDGQHVAAREDGLYARSVETHLGINKVTIEAQDHAENSAIVRLHFRCQAPPAVKGDVDIVFRGKVDDPKATVTVNGKAVTVNADGSFECRVVPDANGKITVVAVDEFGNESRTIHDLRGQ